MDEALATIYPDEAISRSEWESPTDGRERRGIKELAGAR
jgi:hypothetical protein